MTSMNLTNSDSDSAKQAVSFLNKQVDDYKKKLNKTEQALAKFKSNHAELMPGTNDYVTQVQQLNASIDSIEDQLAGARDRKSYILQQMRSGGGGTSVPPAQSQQVQSLDNQLSAQEQKLSQLLTNYTPKYPDVIDAKRQIADLKKRRTAMLARLRVHPGEIRAPANASSGGGSGLLSGQLGDAKVQIGTLESSLQRKQNQLKKLQAGADSMNGAQAQLAKLSRNYQVTREQYQKLLSRLYSARLSTDVQNSSDPLKFRVIDPPVVPAKPSGPKRKILMVLSLIGATVAGLAFAWFLAQIRPVFSSRRALTEATGFPVIGAISLALSPKQRAGRRRAVFVFVFCCASLLVGFAAAIALLPIGVQWVPNIISGQIL